MYGCGSRLNIAYPQFGVQPLSYEDLCCLAKNKGFSVTIDQDLPTPAMTIWEEREIVHRSDTEDKDLPCFRRDFSLATEVGHVYLDHEPAYQQIDILCQDPALMTTRGWLPAFISQVLGAEATYFASYALFPGDRIHSLCASGGRTPAQIHAALRREAYKRYPDSKEHLVIECALNIRLLGHLFLDQLRGFPKDLLFDE